MYIMEKLLKDKFSIFAFVTAGYPTVEKSIDILLALEKSNVVDVVELGINFSECTADGPVLESCGEIARQNGTNSIFKCFYKFIINRHFDDIFFIYIMIKNFIF